MKAEVFNEVVQEQTESIKSTLLKKAAEYATADDRFHNFNEGAQEVKLDRLKYAEALMQKHITSIRDLINGWETCKKPQTFLDEKFGDAINYLVLIKGMMLEDLGRVEIKTVVEKEPEVVAYTDPLCGEGEKLHDGFKVEIESPEYHNSGF